MTILCLAIVGKNNEPLYLCDCNFDKDEEADAAVNDEEDIFGFASESTKGGENALSLDNEVRADRSAFSKCLPFTLIEFCRSS